MEAGTRTLRLATLAACGVIAIGSLGPWEASVSSSHAGVSGDGLFTLVVAAVAALLPVRRGLWATTAIEGLGVACAAIAVYNVVDISGSTREMLGRESIEVGWGLWLVVAGSVALAVSAHLYQDRVTGRGGGLGKRLASAMPERARKDPALAALVVLLALGVLLRVWFTAVWSPAITGYSDTGIYFQGAVESLWSDPIRMVGYSMFLRALHDVVPHLLFVVIVQHVMGLAAAVLIFLAVRRCGGPPALGLAPAAVIALGGDELFLEHAALSDALFIFLIAATLYCTVRASEDRAWWAALAGLSAGLAVWDRTVGLGLVGVIALWLAFCAGRPTRGSLTAGALSLVVALATVGVYAGWRSAAADLPGTLTSNNAWNLYGRVAPWADCDEFTPPAGTEGLCEATPASQRGYVSGEVYIYSSDSPAQHLFGPPFLVSENPRANELLQEWSQAAIRGQPLDYLNAVWRDTLRLFSPNTASYGDLSADAMIGFMLYGPDRHSGVNEFVESWQSLLYPDDPSAHRGDIEPLMTWEAMTRIVGLWMGILLALCLAGPWLLSGRARAGMILFAASALVLLFFPILVKSYDYRFVIPAYAPLVAAGALSAWGVVVHARAKLGHNDGTSGIHLLRRRS